MQPRGPEEAGGCSVGPVAASAGAAEDPCQARPHTAPAWNDGDAASPLAAARRAHAYGHAAAAPEPPTSPAVRPSTGLLQGLRQGSPGSLAGLARSRPGSPGAGASPTFEVRGASLLGGGESPRPASPKAPGAHDSHAGKAPGPAGAVSLQVRAGYAAMHRSSSGGSGSAQAPAGGSPQRQHARSGTPAGEAGAAVPSPPRHYYSQDQQPAHGGASASPRHYQQYLQRPRTATAGASGAPSSSSSARSSVSGVSDASSTPYTTYHIPLPLAGQGSSAASQGGEGARAPAYNPHLMHHNPLFSSAAMPVEGQAPGGGSRSAAAAPACPSLLGAMAGLTIATRAPPSPKAGISSATGTPSAQLQAASNLTLVSDSRPISPGPFLSAFVSGAATDSGSRPVSPHFMDQPPTPGSFATGPDVAGFHGGSPTRAAGGSPLAWPSSAPGSPSTAAAGLGQAAAVPPAGFRTPIYNRDGKFVGWKQNSNYLKPVAAAPSVMPSSAPSSPSKVASAAEQPGVPAAKAPAPAGGEAQQPAAAKAGVEPSQRGVEADFEEFAAEPHKGFPDAANQVPGYVLGPVLGKGGFCSVRKALHELTGGTVACKIIEKGRLKDPKDRDRVDREVRVMRNLSNHVAVVRLYEHVETPNFVYIMMEHCTRGSLLEYVRDKKRLPEEEAVTVLQQLLHALQFCHRKDVVHRDIKLENILIDGEGCMKLIDFGLCGYYVAGKRLRCHCGSPSYAAPEIVARKDYLGPPVDVWSLGVVLFAMLAGYLPFHAKEKKQLSEKILSGVYKPASWMSPDAMDLLARMLTLDPDQRITLDQVWQHRWVAGAKRWEPPGVGSGRIYRLLTDPSTGSIIPDEAVLEELEARGMDAASVRRALRQRECNALTAAYHLQHEAHVEALRAAAKAPRLEADFQWDFSMAATARRPASPVAPGPVGPGAAAAATGSPSRFHQEAAGAAAKAASPAAREAGGVAGGEAAQDGGSPRIRAVGVSPTAGYGSPRPGTARLVDQPALDGVARKFAVAGARGEW